MISALPSRKIKTGLFLRITACLCITPPPGGYSNHSRLYLAADGTFDQVTQDHSLIAEMVRLGELTPEQARNHPDKNIITRAVGTQDTVKIDFFDIQLEEGNQLVMCSDGLSNMVTDEEIFELICREDGEDKAKRLIDKANANGGRDNIAVIVVEPFTNEVKEC